MADEIPAGVLPLTEGQVESLRRGNAGAKIQARLRLLVAKASEPKIRRRRGCGP